MIENHKGENISAGYFLPVKHVPLSPSYNHKEQECSYVIGLGTHSIEANETTQSP